MQEKKINNLDNEKLIKFIHVVDCLNMYKIYAYNYENCIKLLNQMG